MINRFKLKLKNWLFVDEEKRYETLQLRLHEEYKKKVSSFEEWKTKLTVSDLVREKLIGFNPLEVEKIDSSEYANILDEIDTEGTGRDAFLAGMKDAHDNKSLQRLITFLVRNQIMYSAKEAKDLESINFGRATINGLCLCREEIDRMFNIWEESHKPSEHYDTHEVI